jgi:2-hydroxychromene-2-carboxylate isomerase
MVSAMPVVEFHFDVASPNAYLAHAVIPAIAARSGARFRYVPVLLGGIFKLTNNRSPLEAFAGVRNKLEYERLETERFVRRHALARFRANPHFPVNSLRLMRGAVAAEMDGALTPYVDAVFHHMWEEPKKMDDAEVMRAALDASGLDGARILQRTEDPAVKQQLINRSHAAASARPRSSWAMQCISARTGCATSRKRSSPQAELKFRRSRDSRAPRHACRPAPLTRRSRGRRQRGRSARGTMWGTARAWPAPARHRSATSRAPDRLRPSSRIPDWHRPAPDRRSTARRPPRRLLELSWS